MHPCSRRAFMAGLLAAAGAATSPSAVRSAAAANGPRRRAPLRLGVTPVILEDRVGFLNRWGAWLGEHLRTDVELVQRTRYREIVDLLLRGRLDLAWICGYPYVQHRDRLSLIAVPRWRGQPLYRSEIIVPVDSAAAGLSDLRDGLFAWSDPDSNSGWLYPRFKLRSSGQDPDRFFRRTIFTWGHARSVQAVAEGLTDGAAVDSYVRETLLLHEPRLAAAVRVVERSPLFGFPPIVGGPSLAADRLQRVREVLLGQDADAEGRALLADLNLDGFAEASSALYGDIAAMAERIDGRQPA
ncbi:MAG: PhnD/SsuA/transferrin family substrate-binding protein [Thiohalocapsa sp.]|nr:PhnD/SsuA/transferrin family substrate-binding protein [Thiohalocapsa sp.]